MSVDCALPGGAESQATPHPSSAAPWRLCLVVAGGNAHSRSAIENLRQLCAHHLPPCEVEVLDIYRDPSLAARYQVVAAPTLLRLSPLPVRRVVGDLADAAAVLCGLGLPAASAIPLACMPRSPSPEVPVLPDTRA
jgi:circadian clock protein KaiB